MALNGRPPGIDARALGPAAILTAAVLWGSIGVISLGLFAGGITPMEVAFWRATLSTLALLLYLGFRSPATLHLQSSRDLILLTAFGAVGVALFYVAFQMAIELTSVAVAVVLLYTAPIFVILGAWLVLGEPLTSRALTAGALVVGGVTATAFGAAGAEIRLSRAGIVWGITAALAYSSYYLFGRRYLPRFGVQRTLFYSLLGGSASLAVAYLLLDVPVTIPPPAHLWPHLLAISIGTTLLANSLYYWGLRSVQAGRAAILATVEPLVAAVLALLLFGERLGAIGWFGVALVVSGVGWGSWPGGTPPRRGAGRTTERPLHRPPSVP